MSSLIVIENLFTDEIIDYVFKLAEQAEFEESKVGHRVDPDQKIRLDTFLRGVDCAPIDSHIFNSTHQLIKDDFDIDLEYRERWKIGFYDGNKQGHYNPHTDVQGGMEHRQLSYVIALTDPDDYEGGELVFPELERELKPKKGTGVVFKSDILHGVQPVVSGSRYMLLSFMFDQDNGLLSGKDLAQYTPQLLKAGTAVNISRGNVIKHYSASQNLSEPAGSFIAEPLSETMAENNLETTAKSTLDESHAHRNASKLEQPGLGELNAQFQMNPQGVILRAERLSLSKTSRGYLLPLTADSGPGNQIMGIKEALIMGDILNRVVLLPPIHQHYTEGKRSWPFNDILQYNAPGKARAYSDEDPALVPKKCYVVHGSYLDTQLKIENILELELPEQLLQQRRFSKLEDYQELLKKDDSVLCVKHLFNNTVISECQFNGCIECGINPKLEQFYSNVCKNLDFSNAIKNHCNDFIEKSFSSAYIAVHLRYPDVMGQSTLKEITGFDESDIHNALIALANRSGIEEQNVFIATNKAQLVKNSALNKFKLYDVEHEDEVNSFVEQYICCRSKMFVMSKHNDYNKLDEPHQRSTWSTFVSDYRKYRLGIEDDLVLNNLLGARS